MEQEARRNAAHFVDVGASLHFCIAPKNLELTVQDTSV